MMVTNGSIIKTEIIKNCFQLVHKAIFIVALYVLHHENGFQSTCYHLKVKNLLISNTCKYYFMSINVLSQQLNLRRIVKTAPKEIL